MLLDYPGAIAGRILKECEVHYARYTRRWDQNLRTGRDRYVKGLLQIRDANVNDALRHLLLAYATWNSRTAIGRH